MRPIFLLFAAALPAFCQPMEGTSFIDMGADVISTYQNLVNGSRVLESTIQYSWSITRASNGDKVFTFTAKYCSYLALVPHPFLAGFYLWSMNPVPVCYDIAQSAAETLGPIAAALKEFYNYHPNAPHEPPVYNPTLPPAMGPYMATPVFHTRLTTATPLVQPDPTVIFLDGLSYNLLQLDLSTDKILSTVVVPNTSGPLGIRPVSTGAVHEVWTANGGAQVTVADLTSQSVVTNIPTPSIPQAAAPAGIVFTPDGATAFEAVGLFSPDANGNSGALLVFDAANRKLTSTFPLKYAPTAVVMAPDGYTVYLLASNGMLTYYDVLSGTADLSVSTYTPGLAGGYPGSSGQVFITPDGTRLYWNTNYLITGFDLTTRKIATTVNSGLPGTSGVNMQMSQMAPASGSRTPQARWPPSTCAARRFSELLPLPPVPSSTPAS